MAKLSRAHAPHCIFHITARTQGHRPWFTEKLRTLVANEITEAARFAGVRLFALAVMSNHFHIVLRQGTPPLCYMMHRVMHRTAMILKRTHKLQGHVFERRYRSAICATPRYARRAIVYTHLNPWRARLCTDPADYQWSTHSLYLSSRDNCADLSGGIAVLDGLRLFRRSADHDDALQQYIEHIRFQMAIDRFLRGELPEGRILAPAECSDGDSHWFEEYASAVEMRPVQKSARSIYDVARQLLERLDPECPIDAVRSNSRCRQLVFIRRNLVLALIAQNFRGVDIARFMGISPSAVSMIGAVLRN